MTYSIARPEIVFIPHERKGDILSQLAALLEVLVVIGASTLAVVAAGQFLNPGLVKALGFTGDPVDYLAASLAMGKQFALQYGVVLALVLAFAFLRGRKSLRSYALTTRPIGFLRLLMLGVIAGGILSIPTQSIFLAKEIWPLGKDTPLWTVMESNPWDRSFWIFAAVASFALVPIIEELTWRSYALGRLLEAFKPGAAVFTITLCFALLHTQYLANGDALGYLTMGALIFISLFFALLTVTTGSVMPAIIAHAIVNIPMSFDAGAVRLAVGLVLLVVFIQPVLRYVRLLFSSVFNWDTLIAILLLAAMTGAAIFTLLQGISPMIILAGLALLSLALSAFSKSAWRQTT
ncbi:type II CAAX endopeptidase family protein [Hyphococcus flavus]|uniref:Type II CAAX endopeptidase family protein n=1 Tax=Hyphococcus flavus TaxID=1866326 RepID=A0AAE9ZHT3_9PROT|nr:type II CAAX endopeptidase family protein [Hyphococcus flavus]WDI31116.1 type II CAAX endopeptidase family protein [Hyphococcus flavus]